MTDFAPPPLPQTQDEDPATDLADAGLAFRVRTSSRQKAAQSRLLSQEVQTTPSSSPPRHA